MAIPCVFLKPGMLFNHLPVWRSTTSSDTILETSDKEPLAFDIYVHVINATFDVRHWNRLDKMQIFLVLSAQSHERRKEKC